MSISASPPSYHTASIRRSSFRASKKQPISKLTISSPMSARPSRQSSTSSMSSSYGSQTSSPSSLVDLEQRATQILDTLYNHHVPFALTPLIHPSAHFTHEYVDEKQINSRKEYIDHWQQKLAKFPDFQATVRECCVDETQGKVWVMSDVICDQAGLRRRQVVDMLTFDGEGILIEGNGFFRRMNARSDD